MSPFNLTSLFTACIPSLLLSITSQWVLTSAQGTGSTEHYGIFETCTADMQRDAHANMELWKCEPRDHIEHLELPNSTYFNMIPDHVRVKRCGGTCSASVYKSCLPTETIDRNVDVLLMPQNSQGGVTTNDCSTVSVVEHVSCTCGCKTTADDCSTIQRFVSRECKCVCADSQAKASCQTQGNYWDETSCSCLCLPRAQWTACHTGYAFNPSIETCACVSISEYASSVLEILIVVLISSMAMISVGLVQCYRTKTGLFREDPELTRGISETSALRLTTSIRRNVSEDNTNSNRSRHSTGTPTPKFMTLNELRDLFRMLSRNSRSSNPSSPTNNIPSDTRSFLSPNINYIPISEATSRCQSSTSVTTTAEDLSNDAEMSLVSSTASPSGPSRIPTIAEALDEFDDDEVVLSDR